MNQGWGTKSRASLLAPVFSLSSVSSTLYLLMKPNPLREHMHWDLSCYRRLSTLSFYSFSVCLLTCWNFRWCFLFPHWFMYLSVILRSSHPAALLFPSILPFEHLPLTSLCVFSLRAAFTTAEGQSRWPAAHHQVKFIFSVYKNELESSEHNIALSKIFPRQENCRLFADKQTNQGRGDVWAQKCGFHWPISINTTYGTFSVHTPHEFDRKQKSEFHQILKEIHNCTPCSPALQWVLRAPQPTSCFPQPIAIQYANDATLTDTIKIMMIAEAVGVV